MCTPSTPHQYACVLAWRIQFRKNRVSSTRSINFFPLLRWYRKYSLQFFCISSILPFFEPNSRIRSLLCTFRSAIENKNYRRVKFTVFEYHSLIRKTPLKSSKTKKKHPKGITFRSIYRFNFPSHRIYFFFRLILSTPCFGTILVRSCFSFISFSVTGIK